MTTDARQWPNRVWAVEGCQGIGRHIATTPVALAESIPAIQEPLGQVDKCQFGVFLGYAANRARLLADDVARLRQVTCRSGAGSSDPSP